MGAPSGGRSEGLDHLWGGLETGSIADDGRTLGEGATQAEATITSLFAFWILWIFSFLQWNGMEMEPLPERRASGRDAYATSTDATVSLTAGIWRSSKLFPCFPLELYKCYGDCIRRLK